MTLKYCSAHPIIQSNPMAYTWKKGSNFRVALVQRHLKAQSNYIHLRIHHIVYKDQLEMLISSTCWEEATPFTWHQVLWCLFSCVSFFSPPFATIIDSLNDLQHFGLKVVGSLSLVSQPSEKKQRKQSMLTSTSRYLLKERRKVDYCNFQPQ